MDSIVILFILVYYIVRVFFKALEHTFCIIYQLRQHNIKSTMIATHQLKNDFETHINCS
jgi:hypothetical protein